MATVVAFFFFKEPSSGTLDFVPPSFKNPIEEKIQKMSLEGKVGQVMFINSRWEELTQIADRRQWAGGIIPNSKFQIPDSELLADSIANFKAKTATFSGIAPFLGIDQEGGTVCRLDWLNCTGQKDIETASEAASLALKRGKELKALNFNVVFAPVLDVAESENDFIYSRTFNGPAADLGVAMIKAFHQEGIIACAKHFPGHGGTKIDSHYQLPVIDCEEACLKERIEPFKRAIEAGVQMIMVGHIQLNSKFQIPNSEKNDKPASLSKYWITDVLRKQLGFHGVIVTDDLMMGAVKVYQPDIAEAAVQAINAGADMVMIVAEPQIQEQVYQRLLKAVSDGEISQTRINESLRRILKLKEKIN